MQKLRSLYLIRAPPKKTANAPQTCTPAIISFAMMSMAGMDFNALEKNQHLHTQPDHPASTPTHGLPNSPFTSCNIRSSCLMLSIKPPLDQPHHHIVPHSNLDSSGVQHSTRTSTFFIQRHNAYDANTSPAILTFCHQPQSVFLCGVT